MPLIVAALVVVIGAIILIPGRSTPVANADGSPAAMGMPFSGYWDRFGISHPSYHGPSANSYADWATDIYAAAGTAVRPRFSGPSLALKVASVTATCGSAGSTVAIDVHTNGLWVGTARYGHLSSVPVTAGQWISEDTVIGSLAQYSFQSGCWEVTSSNGVHTHVTGYNRGGYSCYVDVGSGSLQNAGVTIGAVGGNLAAGARSQCTSDPTPPPPPPPPPPTPTWDAAFVDQGAWLDAARTQPWTLSTAYPTQEGWWQFRLRNTGTVTWSQGGANPVRLGTAEPRDRASSAMVVGSWLSSNRAAGLVESLVPPGGTGTFRLKVRVPAGSGVHRESFQMVAEGATWLGPVVWQEFGRPTWGAEFFDAAVPPAIPYGEQALVTVRMRNTGAATWSTSGSGQMRVGTAGPQNRASAFYSPSWISTTRPTAVKASTPPGGVGVFEFLVRAPSQTITSTETLQLVSDGVAWVGTSFGVRLSTTPPLLPSPSPNPTLSPPSPPAGSAFTSLSPSRVLNTRSGAKVGNAAGTGVPYVLKVLGQGGVPTSGVGAVALNVTVTQTEDPTIGGGYVTVYPCGTRPDASNLNFVGGQTIPNSVIAPVSATGEVCFYVYGTAHLLADVSGYFPAGSAFESLSPSRVLNTRSGAKVGNAAGTGAPYVLNVLGQGGVPTSGVGAVALNVTVTQTEDPTIGGGYVTVYPCGTRPDASNLNFVGGQTIPNSVIAPVSANGEVCFYVYGTAHLLADVSGYFPAGSGFASLSLSRVLNTRSGAKVGNAAGTGVPYVLKVLGQGGVPTSGVGAVALNVTVTQTEDPTIGGGYVTVYPCGTRPDASNLNFVGGQTIPNSVIGPVSTSGEVCFYVYGTAHLLADVSGYFTT